MTWYTGDTRYDTALAVGFGIVAFTAVAALFVKTPYGRFADEKFGVGLDPRLGWFLMELPAPVTFGKSKTPSTASAPSAPEAMSSFATPTRSSWTTTSPAVTSEPGV